jgi:hypothetical protein
VKPTSFHPRLGNSEIVPMTPWAGVLLILVVLATFGCESDPGFKTIEGRVHARYDKVRGPVDPVGGAKVSNNWDQTTATTDSSGRFVIRVRRVAADEFMVLRVETGVKAACQRLAGTSTGHVLEIFLDGGPFGHQRCQSS